MLRQQHRFFRSVLIASDAIIVALASILAYVVRFEHFAELGSAADEPVAYASHAIPVLVAVPIMMGTLMWAQLYVPRRDQRFYREFGAIFKAVVLGVALTFAFMSFFRDVLFEGRNPSRWQLLFYAALLLTMLGAWRFAFRVSLRVLRRRGWNLRHVAIIGTGRLGQVVHRTLMRNSWTGITPNYFISHHGSTNRKTCSGLPVFGGLDELEQVLENHEVSGVFIAIPGRMGAETPKLMTRLERFPVDVRVVPDMNPKFLPLNMAAHDLEGMPILSVRESPLSGWGGVMKRTVDLAGGLAALLIFGLPMLIIAGLVRMSGPGPVIFRQRRMSLNGQQFDIFKFRTMKHVTAEAQALEDRGKGSGAWTKKGDPRITPVGRFLRKTSLDELPQLFNVLLGEMSLVGPRPERPELIESFRDDWRGYMLRQNVKAGMTGWAQVNGLRGDTDLRKRLQYDLFYIRNWSLGFDMRILWMTIFRGFAHPNAN